MPTQRARKGPRRNRTLTLLSCAALLALVGQSVRADVIISNTDQPHSVTHNFNTGDVTTGDQVGAAIIVGGGAVTVSSILINEENFGPPQPQTGTGSPGETFAIYSRNPDGTLGVPVFPNFMLNFVPTNTYTTQNNTTAQGGFEIATPITPVVLSPNTGYFLVLSDKVPGSFVAWDFTPSTIYHPNGAVMPATRTTVVRIVGQTDTYFNLSDGPQIYQINGTAVVPEPGPLALAAVASGLAGVGCCWKKIRRGQDLAAPAA